MNRFEKLIREEIIEWHDEDDVPYREAAEAFFKEVDLLRVFRESVPVYHIGECVVVAVEDPDYEHDAREVMKWLRDECAVED